ncbi:MAG TPA: DMT family transporter [Acidimicrobiales bacterium]|nr:DMT family transporter [Acidimicrobiales bacterium]
MRRLALLAFIWGWSFLFIKVAVEGMTPSTVAAARVFLGFVVLAAVLRVRGLRMPAGLVWWRHFAVVALVGSVLPFTLLAWGEQRVSSALTSVLNASTPLFAALFVAAFLGERLRPVQIGGLLLGFVGVGVAAGLGGGDLAESSIAGEAAAVLAGVGYGVSFAYTKRHLVGIPPLVAATGQLAAGTAMLLPVALITTAREGISLTPRRVLAISLLGVFGTGIAYVLNYRSIAELGPTVASVVTYLVPVVAVVVGVVFLDEPFELRLLLGGGLTVAGIVMLNGRPLRRPPAPTPAPAAGH